MTVQRLKATAETRKLLSNKMAKLPWVHGPGLVRRTYNSSKGRRMVNVWTKELQNYRILLLISWASWATLCLIFRGEHSVSFEHL